MCCVRGPSWSTRRSLVQGSLANHSHRTWVLLPSRASVQPLGKPQTARLRSGEKESSAGTRECGVEHSTCCGKPDNATSGSAQHDQACHPQKAP
jgi:hypothetical protein